MKQTTKIFGVMFGLTFVLATFGCSKIVVGTHPGYEVVEHHGPPPWAPAHGYRAKHHYRYYPASHVYFDDGRGLYFYYEGGGWRVGASLPVGIHLEVHDFVEIEMDTDKPYVFHSEVVKKYPPGQAKKLGMGKGKWKWK
jgi:hypothetical protein